MDQRRLAVLSGARKRAFVAFSASGFRLGPMTSLPGALLGRVQIRPIVWSVKPIPAYSPAGAHPEFSGAIDIEAGQILALDDELIIEVTRPPLPAVESIFEIISSEEIPEGRFEIDTEQDRVSIKMGEKTYQLVQELRQTDDDTRAVVMNALYAPIIMEVLEQLGEAGFEPFEPYRWLHPFKARCELTNIDIQKLELLNDAQKILSQPFGSLSLLTQYEGDEA